MSKFRKNQKVWFLVTEKPPYTFLPVIRILTATVVEARSDYFHRGFVLVHQRGYGHRYVSRKTTLPKTTDNHKIMVSEAKKYLRSIFRKRAQETKEIEDKYKRWLSK